MIKPVPQIFDFFLTEEERNSTVWQNLKARFEKKLETLRLQNDNSKLTDVETATLRGQIRCLKAVIALGEKPPEMMATAARPTARPDYGVKYG